MNDSRSLGEILALIEEPYAVVGGDDAWRITSVDPVNAATAQSLSFVDKGRPDAVELLVKTAATATLCEHGLDVAPRQGQCFITVADPKRVFAHLLSRLFAHPPRYSIHPTAVVHPKALIHRNVHIGPLCSIGEVSIGKGTVIHSHCHIGDGVKIGEDVIIGPGVVLGSEGVGHFRDGEGRIITFPQLGGVTIGDRVEIGACSCIDRGTLANTVVEQDVKINELVYIAHNAVVKEGSFVLGHAMICGSVVIGKNAWIAPSAVIRDGICVGAGATIGLGAVVTAHVPDGETWAGVPARLLLRNQIG